MPIGGFFQLDHRVLNQDCLYEASQRKAEGRCWKENRVRVSTTKIKVFFVKRKERRKGFGGFLKRREQEGFFPQRNGQKKRKAGQGFKK